MQDEIRETDFVKFRGVKIDNVNYGDAYSIISNAVEKSGKGYVCLTDVGNVIGATQDSFLCEAINSSLLSLADGTPLAWYARLVGCRAIERISGMDLMVNMISKRDGFRHFLLGDTEQRISRVMEKAGRLNENIRIKGFSPPFKDFDDQDNEMMLNILNDANPDIIWVSFGGGKQEKWMYNNISKLNRGVMIGVGAAFKWMIGDLKTPPKAIQKMGLQWVYRISQALIRDPKKYAKIVFTKILKRKLIFAFHFPGEVIRARRRYGT